jgi:hypothetical protein
MTKLMETEDEILENEILDVPSKNHSFTMGRITGLLFNDERFTVMPELSLDTSPIDLSQFNLKAREELILDICVYRGIASWNDSYRTKLMFGKDF